MEEVEEEGGDEDYTDLARAHDHDTEFVFVTSSKHHQSNHT